MSNDGSLGQQSQNAAGRPHIVKVLVGLPFAVDFRVGILHSLLQRVRRGELKLLEIEMRDRIGSKLTREFPGRMRTHAISDQKQMTAATPTLHIGCQFNRV